MKTRSKKAEIEFDAVELVRRVEDFAAGTHPTSERQFKLPPPVQPMAAREIRALRAHLGFTQAQFAALLNVPKVTAISMGKRHAQTQRGGAAAAGRGAQTPGSAGSRVVRASQ